VSKAKAILKDLRNLDLYIASLIRRRDKVEASLLSSQKYSVDKVSGGIKKKQDDIYVELLTAKNEIEQKTAEAIRKQRELQGLIDSLDNTDSQAILSLVYIDKMTRWQVMDELNCSESTYFRLLRIATKELDAVTAFDSKLQ
jgi:DNA-directed RNA polymerase specialized sigma subunit